MRYVIIILFLIVLILTVYFLSRRVVEPFERAKIEPVWAFWENPPNQKIPDIVKRCYKNWKTIGEVKDIRFLNPSNIEMYIPKRELKRIERSCDGNLAVKSDFIGLYLISKYGGTVIDGTVFMNEPLRNWLPNLIGAAPFFCFDATRYGSVTPETFFMYGQRGSQVAARWYELGLKVGASGVEGRNKFISKVNKEFPGILDDFPKDNYLWMYMVGKYMLLRYPALRDQLNVSKSEDDPLRTIAESNWETEATCEALKLPQTTRITKLDNGLWKNCSVEIVPL